MNPACKNCSQRCVVKKMSADQPHVERRTPSARNRSVLRRAAITAVLSVIAGSVWIGSASASSPIEGIWSFNGGKVAIQSTSGGTFTGTVVAPTTFAQCTHPIGEEMWKEMRLQENGSYWGLHQWFYETSECIRNPRLGPTAWRVMEAPNNGGRYLLVCFSSPEDPIQPMIGPNGETSGDSYNCTGSAVESGHVASLTETKGGGAGNAGVESFGKAVSLPSNKQCLSHRIFRIHLVDPKYDPIKEVVVTLRKRRTTVRRHGNVFTATIDLKGLPRGTFTVKIQVTTVLGHHLDGSRTYHTCVPGRHAVKPSTLPRSRSH